MDEDRLLTLEAAASRLGVRWATVRELVETGQLRAVKIGTRYRVPASALREVGQLGVSLSRTAGGGAGRDGTGSGRLFPFKRGGADGGR
jgi:excisionase family DNA binding protein